MYRVEDKYHLPLTTMLALEKRIADVLEPDPNNIEGRGYLISSLYFDNYKDTCLRDTIDGVSPRDKFRIRIYNNSFETIKLEVKRKNLNRTLKFSSTISRQEYEMLCDGDTIEENSDSLDDARVAFNRAVRTRLLRPKVIVTYDRNAYICEEGNVRVTFDRNVRGSFDLDGFGDPDLIYDHPEGIDSVLEVKYDEYLPQYIAQLIENNEMLQTSNSKYKICRELQ